MASETGRQTPHLKEQLLTEGHRFSFVQAVRFLVFLLRRKAGPDKDIEEILKRIRVRPELSLSFPEADVTSIKELPGTPSGFLMTSTFLGLYGAASPLPTFYTEDLLQERAQDRSVNRDFIDIFNSRLYSLYFAVWSHYRLFYQIGEAGQPEVLHRLYCLLGFEGTGLRDEIDDVYGLIRYIGLFSQFPRSAEGLRSLLADSLGEPSVAIEQGVERMAPIPADQCFSLGRSGNSLGDTAYLGHEIADRMGKIRIRIGPVSGASFADLLPGRPRFQKMGRLIRYYLDQPLIWDADILLEQRELEVARLGDGSWSQLGFNTWIYSGPAPDIACRARFGTG